ncbi:hypothetical protein Zmor_004001 [Zophobas morio]|jgi:hypothetical protein|uniref:Uncharacterized protein n=1 Tax=Zophobas morio TaxID=2755281 RepID=A0AA38LZS4_9CUCU|nr:hypothetical protein Zmor_004001 [Zophobas morio]
MRPSLGSMFKSALATVQGYEAAAFLTVIPQFPSYEYEVGFLLLLWKMYCTMDNIKSKSQKAVGLTSQNIFSLHLNKYIRRWIKCFRAYFTLILELEHQVVYFSKSCNCFVWRYTPLQNKLAHSGLSFSKKQAFIGPTTPGGLPIWPEVTPLDPYMMATGSNLDFSREYLYYVGKSLLC